MPQLPAGCTVTYTAAWLDPATTQWVSGRTHRFLGVHLAEQRYRLEGERTLLGKQGRLGWIMSLQLCPCIWALILFLLYLLVFKVSLVASIAMCGWSTARLSGRQLSLRPASKCLATVLARIPASLPVNSQAACSMVSGRQGTTDNLLSSELDGVCPWLPGRVCSRGHL